jgi:dienelactone hydrolase
VSPLKLVLAVLALFGIGRLAFAAPSPENIVNYEFVPPAGQGRVVIVLSGAFGPGMHSGFPAELAKVGYYAVLFDGRTFSARRPGAGDDLRQVILRAQRSPHASPGKVAVIGFSAGGGGALAYATSMSDLVAVVVAYYPVANGFADREAVVRRWNVPTVMLAGESDQSCRIEIVSALAASLKERGAPAQLVTYPGTGHDFNLSVGLNKSAAEDAWQRTLAALRQHPGT